MALRLTGLWTVGANMSNVGRVSFGMPHRGSHPSYAFLKQLKSYSTPRPCSKFNRTMAFYEVWSALGVEPLSNGRLARDRIAVAENSAAEAPVTPQASAWLLVLTSSGFFASKYENPSFHRFIIGKDGINTPHPDPEQFPETHSKIEH